MSRIRFVVAAATLGLMVLGTGTASAQDYPNRPLRVVTAAAGGSSDFTTRLIADPLSRQLHQQVVVDNRGGVIPGEIVSKALPDGYTLMFSSESLWIRSLMQKVPYDVVREFSPISQLVREVGVVTAHASLPAKSVKELIALAKAKPGELNYGSGPKGSGTHLHGALFASMAGINIVHVPFKGTGLSVTALIGGEVQLMFANPALVMPHAKSGKLRVLAVTSAEPSALVPGLPTVAASGVPGYEATSMAGLFAPAKTPAAVINRLHQEMVRVVVRPDVKEQLLNAGIEVVANSSPEQFAATIKSDIARLGKVIRDAGIKAD